MKAYVLTRANPNTDKLQYWTINDGWRTGIGMDIRFWTAPNTVGNFLNSKDGFGITGDIKECNVYFKVTFPEEA